MGDLTSWVRPCSVIVESQEGCGFSRSLLKSPSEEHQHEVLQCEDYLSCSQSHRTIHKKLKGCYTENTQKDKGHSYLAALQTKCIPEGHCQGLGACM